MSDLDAVLARLEKITKGKWRVRDGKGLWWSVETELPCINGLRCWFTITRCDFDLAADGYTDGAVSPEDDARAIALLPELIAVAKAAAELRKMPRTGDASVEKMTANLDAALSALAKRGME